MPRLCPLLLGAGILINWGSSALALPPLDDIPEEILRTEIVTEARSPINGEPLSADEYAALQERLRDPNVEVITNPDIAQLIELLRFRRVLKPILPFL